MAGDRPNHALMPATVTGKLAVIVRQLSFNQSSREAAKEVALRCPVKFDRNRLPVR